MWCDMMLCGRGGGGGGEGDVFVVSRLAMGLALSYRFVNAS